MKALLALSLPMLLGPEAPPAGEAASPGMIRYEIRLVDCEALGWREDFQPRLRFGGHRAGSSAWVADEATLAELADRFSEAEDARVVSAPKVTAFAGNPATIGTCSTRHFVVHAEPGESAGGEPDPTSPKPVVAPVDDGSQIHLVGQPGPEGVHLKVDVIDSRIAAVHVVESGTAAPGSTVQFQVPEVTRREMGGEWLVPEGHGLVLSMGVESSAVGDGTQSVRERLLLISPEVLGRAPARPEVDPRLTRASSPEVPPNPGVPDLVPSPPIAVGVSGPTTPRIMRAGAVPTALAATPWGLLPIVPIEYDAATIAPGAPMVVATPAPAPPPAPEAVPAPAMPLPKLPTRTLPPAIDTDGRAVDPRTDRDREAERTEYAPFVDGKPVASPQVTVPVPGPVTVESQYEGVATPTRPARTGDLERTSAERTTPPAKTDRKMIKVRLSLGLARGLSVDVDLGADPDSTGAEPPAEAKAVEAKAGTKADPSKDTPIRR
ncbi:hypothetical protein [Tautonia plasticadhaerens]|uniref:Uncharacterized protein n=1 Tax=Tautonia plasticadhaerens TaxID=2527974 RepID=A0A518GYL9_9BACT|nr:hypothetical protein [Tautonia plasticadhaerens]QDV33643.1 hypothetical protein ElP_15190 [Tautonia plasticadhaerens]